MLARLLLLVWACQPIAAARREPAAAQYGWWLENSTALPPAAAADWASHTLACHISATPCPSEGSFSGSSLRWSANATGSMEQPSSSAGPANELPNEPKPLWPLAWTDVAGFLAAAAALMLAASGGVGGGGLLIPIYMLVLGFSTARAVALSNITVVGGTLTNTLFNIGRRHPFHPGPLIDWELILVMEPSTILGAVAGGFLNHILPAWLTTVLLSALLTFVTANLLRRGLATFRKESRQLQLMKSELEQEEVPKLPNGDGGGDGNGSSSSSSSHLGRSNGSGGASDGSGAEQQQQQVQQEPITLQHSASFFWQGRDTEGEEQPGGKEEEQPPESGVTGPEQADGSCSTTRPSRAASGSGTSEQLKELTEPLLGPGGGAPAAQQGQQPAALRPCKRRWKAEVPVGKVAILAALLLGVVVSDTLRAGLPCPSLPFWVAALSMVPVTLVVLALVRAHLIRAYRQRTAAPGYLPAEGEVAWTPRTTLVYPALCTFAGLVAGVFGVGGGIVKGPLMLEMGVQAQVAAATSACMIMFTSAAACVVFVGFGAVQWDYGAALFVVALTFTALGQLATKWIMARLGGRSSVIVFAMAAILGISAVLLGLQGMVDSRAAFAAHRAWDWGSVCGHGSHT